MLIYATAGNSARHSGHLRLRCHSRCDWSSALTDGRLVGVTRDRGGDDEPSVRIEAEQKRQRAVTVGLSPSLARVKLGRAARVSGQDGVLLQAWSWDIIPTFLEEVPRMLLGRCRATAAF